MHRVNQFDRIVSGVGHKQKEENYWLERLSGDIERCSFPYDYKNLGETGAGEITRRSISELEFKITGAVFEKINKLSTDSLPRLHMILTAGLIALINKYIGMEDIILGSPIFKQAIETDFINTVLVLRSQLTPNITFKELLLQVRQNLNEAVQNQNYPIERILQKLKIPYNPDEDFPLFDIAVLLENIHKIEYLQHINLSMIFSFKKTDEFIVGKVYYNENLYEKITVEHITAHFDLLMHEALRDLDLEISRIILCTEEEKKTLLSYCNTSADFPQNKSIHQLFEEQTEKKPDLIAVGGPSLSGAAYIQITYRKLNETSDRLAKLLQQKGVESDTIVGIMMERSVEMQTGIFGIVKAGGSYLPIDPDYPQNRIDFMIADSRVKIVLTAGVFTEKVKPLKSEKNSMNLQLILMDQFDFMGIPASPFPIMSTSQHPASGLVYIIYTSGTTSNPKGTCIEHHSLVNRLNWMQKKYPLDSWDVILHKTPFTFDVSVWEIFWWSIVGASVCLLKSGNEKDPLAIAQAIEKNRVTVMHFVPSMLSVFLDFIKSSGSVEKLSSLKQLIASGEALTSAQVILFNRLVYANHNTRLANLYGPTEATIDVTYFDCPTGEDFEKIPIGKPIDNICLYILDKHSNILPPGIAGELNIAGIGLARGYLNRPELTAERFKKYRSYRSNRTYISFYKTGDLARWLHDGNIEYLGRMDFQVKIRGFRIELGEIENRLMMCEGIKDAVVVVKENSNKDKFLCAFVVVNKSHSFPNIGEYLSEYLSKDLPYFMVPHHFVELERIPLTPNGKVDRRALPDPESYQSGQYVEPGNDIQKELAQLWSETLGLEKIGITDVFFRIGGDSITAIRLASLINKRKNTNITVLDIYNNETIEKLALIVEGTKMTGDRAEVILAQQEVDEIKNRIVAENNLDPDIEDIFPMSDIEKGMTFYMLMNSESAMYHDQFVYQVKHSNFEILRLEKALALLVEKHGMLRTAFNLEDFGESVHVLYKNIPIDIRHFDISDMTKSRQEEYIRNFIQEDRQNTFDIVKPPLWRIRVFSINRHRICVLWIFLHALLDGWSVASLMTELNNTYVQLKKNPGYVPEKLHSTYKHSVIQEIAEKKKDEIRLFWERDLENYKRLDMSGLKSDNESPTRKKALRYYGPAMLERLNRAAGIYNSSVKHLCLAAYIYMLHMISYEDEIVAGLVTNNRPVCEDGERILGCFLNTIPIRIKIPPSSFWEDYIRSIDNKMLELKEYERLSFFEILRVIGEKPTDRNPIFDTIFNFVDFHVYLDVEMENEPLDNESNETDSRLAVDDYERTNTLFDFNINITRGDFRIFLIYSNMLVSDNSAARLLGYFENIIEQMQMEPGKLIDKCDIIPLEEKKQILYNFNDTVVEYSLDKTIHELFSEQVERTPDYNAIVGPSIRTIHESSYQMTYRKLDEETSRLARLLREKCIGPGDIAAIMVDRSHEMVIGIMGTLKAGGAYLPMDPAYPLERIDFLLKDSQAKILLTTKYIAKTIILHKEMIYLESLSSFTSRIPGFKTSLPSDPVYVIYTSGTTGKPKGVIIEHRSLVNRLNWMQKKYPIDQHDTILQKTTYTFDVSVWEIFWWCIVGAKVCLLIPGGEKDPEIITQTVARNHVTTLHFVPSMLSVFLDYVDGSDNIKKLSGLKKVFASGEALTLSHVKRFNELLGQENGTLLANLYGPTEATIDVSYFDCTRGGEVKENGLIPIGKPIDNICLYIVDKHLHIQPIGISGELCIAGIGLARGYLNRPELTAEKFKINRSYRSYRTYISFYKTGDLARWLLDGNIEFLGRIDYQVKVRGFRIELGEIESLIDRHEGVSSSVVIARNDSKGEGDDYLCAYITVKPTRPPTVSEMRVYLSRFLPDYMIPRYIVTLDKMPLNRSGKIDRKALPDPDIKREKIFIPPRTLIEGKLTEIWSELLKIDPRQISIEDNFFELGGHSLNAVFLINRIHKKLHRKISLEEIFDLRTIRNLAYSIEKGERNMFVPINLAEKKEYYRCTSAEERMYFLQIAINTTNYNMPLVFKIEGNIDLKKVEDIFNLMIERHRIFRSAYQIIGDKLVKRILTPGQVPFALEYYYNVDHAGVKHTIEAFIRMFDLRRPPLMRAGVIILGESRYIIMLDFHHIIGDGVSMEVFLEEFIAFYRGQNLPILKHHYEDYAEWQISWEQKLIIKKQEAFWLKELEGELPRLNLPLDFPRPSIQSMEGGSIFFDISEEESTFLRKLAIKEKTTPYIALFAMYNIFLRAVSGQEEILIGTFTGKRRHPDLQRIIGVFVSTLVLRNYPIGEKKFISFMGEVKEKTLAAFENQEYEFDELLRSLSIKRDLSRSPVFDAMFSFLNVERRFEPAQNTGTDIQIVPYKDYKHDATRFDIGFTCFDYEKNIGFLLGYCSSLFKAETITKFIGYYKKVVSSVIENPEIKISEIDILSPEEKKQVLFAFNDTTAEYPRDKSIHGLFIEQVERTPDNMAVVGLSIQTPHESAMHMSYRELDEKSNRLARLLVEKGIKVGSIAAIMVDRSNEMIIGILGILKAGGAYLPIDPDYPKDRIDYIIKDSRAKLLAVANELEGEKVRGWEGEKVLLEEIYKSQKNSSYPLTFLPSYLLSSRNLAYIIYTSGTTGRPKGTIIEHRNVVRLMFTEKFQFDFNNKDIWTLFHSFCFDFSVWEMYGALLYGGKLLIISKITTRDTVSYLDILKKSCVTVLNQTPSAFFNLSNLELNSPGNNLSIRYVIFGGEALILSRLKEWMSKYPRTKLINMYGITETTVHVTFKELKYSDTESNISNIGKSIPTLSTYVMDKNLKLLPIGVPGELVVGGEGVGRGYLNRPELSREKFIENPYKVGERLYKSGDLVKLLPGGDLQYLGRIDHQVKIRGFRIELEEIEGQLLKIPGITKAVVLAIEEENEDKYICAYFVADRIFGIAELRENILKELPDYMLPSYFVQLEKIPLTPNGKVDRKALPEPKGISLRENISYSLPSSAVEKKLVEIWEKVLGRNNIGINENFFLIGGDSIKSIQIISRMNMAGYKLELKDLFQYPVISDLVPLVKKLERIPDQSIITGPIPLTPIQKDFFNEFYTDSFHYNQAVMLYSKEGFDKEATKAVFGMIQEHHDALRMTYKINPDNGKILQINQHVDYPLFLQVIDLRNREDSTKILELKANEIQASIDLEKGPLMKLGLFHLDDGDRLLIIIHHLVIDGISWRILFEDIETLYSQYKKNEKLILPSKTDSFKLWAEKISEYANSKTFLKEKPYWVGVESNTVPGIAKDFTVKENDVKDTQRISLTLGEEETGFLLTKVNRAFKTEINDILLTALGLGMKKTFGNDRVFMAMESHGREEILEDMDISRTVGWFTTIYPVLLDISYEHDLGRQVKVIKETLRKIPNKGIGYGILKHLTLEANKKEIEFKSKPQISFNYLGQFDADVKQKSSFHIAKESTGNSQSLNSKREYILDVSGMTANNRLTMTILYNKLHFRLETMTTLINNFESKLKQLIAFCCAKENIERTPSDFTYKGLSIETIDRLVKQYPDLEDLYILTPMQQGMLFHTLVDESPYTYFEQMSYRLQGELNVPLVEKSLHALFKRREILRTAFVYEDIEPPVQVVLKDRAIDFYYQDISKSLERQKKEDFIREFKEKDKERSFDLNKSVLARVSILRVNNSEYEFIWSFHHILMDGWCIGILNTEFFEIYTSYLEKRQHQLPAIKPYRTYIQWLEKQDKEESARYWENYLDSFEDQTGVPKTKNLTKEKNKYINEMFSVVLGKEKKMGLDKLAAGNHVTLNTLIQSVWGILLGKYNGKNDVVFGEVVSGRPFELEGIESMVGLFINTIPIRIRFEGNMKCYTLFQKIQEESLASEPHHYHPLTEIQSQSNLKRNLIDHLVIFENYPIAEQIEGYGKEENKSNRKSLKLMNADIFEQTNYDFNIILSSSEQLRIIFQYNANSYDRDFLEKVASHFLLVFDRILENENIYIKDIDILSDEEKNQLLYKFNDTDADYPKDKTIHELFEAQVEKTPNHIALVGQSLGFNVQNPEEKSSIYAASAVRCELTYHELNKQSNQLAQWLAEKGVESNSIIGIMIERSLEMIIGIQGILKSGGAYLPIDPKYPQERIDYILKDSSAKLLITANNNESGKMKKWKGEKLLLEDIFKSPKSSSYLLTLLPSYLLNSSNLAYVIYTSGSTGKPKGVAVSHRAVVNRLYFVKDQYRLDGNDVVLQKTNFNFDVSVCELFRWIIPGAKLCLLEPGAENEPKLILDAITMHNITTVDFVPSMLKVFLDYLASEKTVEKWQTLRWVFIGAEVVPPGLAAAFNKIVPNVHLINAYGPTEATVDVTYFNCANSETLPIIPIGKPMANVRIYILDRFGYMQPIGIQGELCIAGDCLAQGYLNNPGLTAEKFKKYRSYRSNKTYIISFYKTGDLARWLPDGNIEFLGRIDHQVKIRGFRIELGEIENQLLMHKDIKETVVLCREDRVGHKYLCAYIVSNKKIHSPVLRKYLSSHLPDYMIPSFFVNLEKIPLTSNGKVDRKSLPEPREYSLEDNVENIAPKNAIEKKLVEIWEKVLGRVGFGTNQNFFEIGGDSIKLIQVVSRMNAAGYKIKMEDFLKYPTIAKLGTRARKTSRTPVQSLIPGTIPLTPIQEVFFNESHNNPHHYNQAVMFYSPEKLEKEVIKKIFSKIQEHHDALRMTYKINPETQEVIQINHGLDYPSSLEEYDLRNIKNSLAELHTKLNDIQAGINLETGPLMKVGLFHLDDGDRLLIAIHHLVIDGVSWRILFEDIQTLYEQYKKGEKPVLPPKTDSFKLWSEKLSAHANSEILLKEKTYWQKIESVEVPPIPKDFDVDDNFVKDIRNVSFNLGQEETGLLLTKVNQAFKTDINDILLTVLGLTIKKSFGQEQVLLALEGHGREEILEDIDINRTVGWFTSLYPVLMDVSYAGDTGRQIKKIKETLRKIPHKGIGYGILKYLTREDKKGIEFKQNPEIMFNYLGQFDADIKQISLFEIAKESAGNYQSLNNKQNYLLDVSGMIANNRLNIKILYNKTHFKPETIAALVKNFESELKHIIAFCCTKENIEFTPADFTYKELSMESSERLMDLYPEIEDLYTLTPLQEGMLYHASIDESPNSYFQQISYHLEGELDIHLVEKSWHVLFKRYEILRTIFVYKDTERPVQVVLKENPIDFYYEDISKTEEIGDKENYITKFKEEDKRHPFDLSHNVPMRLAILRVAQSRYEFIWSFHHILMDEGCSVTLNAELFEIYTGYLENRSTQLPAVEPYRTYIQWLEKQDKEESARYWENYLDLFANQSGIPKTKALTKDGNKYQNETITVVLSKEKTAALNKLAARNHMQLDTLSQVLWGVFLGKVNEKEDVVFGAVVPNRPYDLPGIERMVGLFINTIPVRIRFNGRMKLNELFRKTREEAAAGERHYHHSLAEIQSRCTLKQHLIDHLFIFQHFSIPEQIEKYGNEKNKSNKLSLKITNAKIFGQTNYDFNIILASSEQLMITCQYNGYAYDRKYIETIANHFLKLFNLVIENEELEIVDLPKWLPGGDSDFPERIEPGELSLIGTDMNTSAEYAAPGNEVEEKIAGIWKKILRLDKIGIHDNYFALGGHSLGLLKMVSAIKHEFELELPIAQLLENPTIRKLSIHICHEQYGDIIDAAIDGKYVQLTIPNEKYMNVFFFPPVIGVGTAYMNLSLHLSGCNIYSFNFIEDDRRIQQYADTIMAIQEKGPYCLFGYSSGGNLAFEVTRELEQRGEQVSDIIMGDAWYRREKFLIVQSTPEMEKETADFEESLGRRMAQLGLGHLKDRVLKRSKNYATYLQNGVDWGKVNARIHLITSIDRQKLKKQMVNIKTGEIHDLSNLDWEKAGDNRIIYEGFGTHTKMFSPGLLEKNVVIIQKILENYRYLIEKKKIT